MNFKFYLVSILLHIFGFFVGFIVGRDAGYNLLVKLFGEPKGEALLTFFIFGSGLAILGSITGLLASLIIIHKLGRRWGNQLNFGGHPVLKLTSLSFLTFLSLLILLLTFYPSK